MGPYVIDIHVNFSVGVFSPVGNIPVRIDRETGSISIYPSMSDASQSPNSITSTTPPTEPKTQ